MRYPIYNHTFLKRYVTATIKWKGKWGGDIILINHFLISVASFISLSKSVLKVGLFHHSFNTDTTYSIFAFI